MDSLEQRTRTEVIHALATVADALRLILQEREHGTEISQSVNEFVPPPAPPVEKKTRAKKEPKVVVVDMTEVFEPQQPKPEEPVTKMAEIKPTKPGKTLADLRVALQDCITKHGMPGAKERLAPFLKISDVPDAEIAATIDRLAAA